MANEFIARKGLIVSGSATTTGAVSSSFFKGDGSQLTNIGSASLAEYAHTSSYTRVLADGVISGGILQVNTDATKFNVLGGYGKIIDSTLSVTTPQLYDVSWPNLMAQTSSFLAGSPFTNVFIGTNGQLILSNDAVSSQDANTKIYLGQLSHNSNTSIANVVTRPYVNFHPMNQLRDVYRALGLINVGNKVTPVGGNLKISKSVGTITGLGVGYDTVESSPNTRQYSAQTPVTFSQVTQTGVGASGITDVDVANYDNNGTITAIGGSTNNVVNHRVYLTPGGTVYIQYGQVIHTSLSDALAKIPNENFVTFPDINLSVLLGVISAKRNTVDLNDTNYAIFTTAGKIGDFGGQGAALLAANQYSGSYTGSFLGNVIGTASVATSASYANVAQTLLGTVSSASFATSSSFASTVMWTGVNNRPIGIVSSSTQISTGSFIGSFSGSLTGSHTGQYTGSILGVLVGSASYAVNTANANTATSSSFASTVMWTGINNQPIGIVSSSAQINTGSFIGSFSGSLTGSHTGQYTGSILGVLVGSASYAVNTATANNATSSSFASTVMWTGVNNRPIGIVSSSAQINTGSFIGAFSGSLTGSYTGQYTGSILGVLVGSASYAVNTANANTATSSSYAVNAGAANTATSSSFASTVMWSGINNQPIGIVSSSTQISTGSFIGTFSGSLSGSHTGQYAGSILGVLAGSASYAVNTATANNATSASYALTASHALNGGGSSVSASYALTSSYANVAQTLLGSVQSAATASFISGTAWTAGGTFVEPATGGALTASYALTAQTLLGSVVSSSYAVTASYALASAGGSSVSASYALTSSYANVAQTLLGSVVSSSYAVTASYALNGGGGGATPVRTLTTISSSTAILQSAVVTGSAALAKGFVVYLINTNQPVRVRLYSTTTARNIDLLRGVNVEPTGAHGVIVDFVSTPNQLTASLAPFPYGAVLDSPVSIQVPYSLTNLQTGSVGVSASLLFLPLE